jgi:hypothetical protein
MIMFRLSVTALALIALSTLARADDKKALLKEAGRQLDIANGYRDASEDRDIKRLRETTAKCLAAVDAALAGGATLDDEVTMPSKKFAGARDIKNELGYWITVAPLREGQRHCRALAARPNLVELLNVVHQDAAWLAKTDKVRAAAEAKTGFDHDSGNQAEVMTARVEPCRAAVARALAAGVDPATPTDVMDNVPVGELRAKVCDALAAAAQSITAVEDAKLEKLLAPYKAALKGQRLATFLDRKMISDTLLGANGKELDTPAKLAQAGAWYLLLSGEVGLGLKSLTVRRYQWSGNKLRSVTERKGCCY